MFRKMYTTMNFKNSSFSYSIRPKLGRWFIENDKKTEIKIRYANEDHCGVCTVVETNHREEREQYYEPFIVQ
jgi:hypothetical protein